MSRLSHYGRSGHFGFYPPATSLTGKLPGFSVGCNVRNTRKSPKTPGLGSFHFPGFQIGKTANRHTSTSILRIFPKTSRLTKPQHPGIPRPSTAFAHSSIALAAESAYSRWWSDHFKEKLWIRNKNRNRA